MSETIAMEKAAIVGVKHKIANGNVSSQIEFVTAFDAGVAKALGARWLFFDKESFPKEGLKVVEMDYELQNFRLVHAIPNLDVAQLDINSELATKFKVMKSGGKKKGKASMRLRFLVHHQGSPFELLEYLIRVGGAIGVLSITPMQKELFAEEKTKETKRTTKKKQESEPSEPAWTETFVDDAGARVWPQPNEQGEYSYDGSDAARSPSDIKHARAVITTLEVESGFAWGYALDFDGGIGSTSKHLSGPVVAAESDARDLGARALFEYSQKVYAEAGTGQVRKAAKAIEDWASNFITRKPIESAALTTA